MIDQKIYYRKARNFGQVFSESFGYIKQNFKTFFGSIILFTLPIIAIITLLIIYMVNTGLSRQFEFGRGGNNFIGEMLFAVFGVFFLFLLVQTVYITVINEHLVINEQMANDEFVKTNHIGKTFFNSFWRVLGNSMLLAIFAIVTLLIYALINGAISAVFATGGIAGILLAGCIQILTSLIITPIIGYIFISSLFVVQKDKVGIITALGKVFRYLKGNFWMTWCVSVVGYIITYFATLIVMIPAIIFMFLQVFSRINYNTNNLNTDVSSTTIIIGSLIFLITLTLALCVYAIYFLMCNFQYTSLEEKKEGSSIIEKINQIQ